LLLDRFLDGKKIGVYVDVGCYHPFRFSNTLRFYLSGWSGVNIDASEESITLFSEYRTRDKNICCSIGITEGVFDYYVMSDAALNTFSKDRALFLEKNTPYKILEIRKCELKRLSTVLDSTDFNLTNIDFMNVDVEGLDIDVLQSNNWDVYSPKYLLVEDHNAAISVSFNSEMREYIEKFGYKLRSILFNTLLYERYE